MTPDKLLDAVRKIKMLTAKPYGVNLWFSINGHLNLWPYVGWITDIIIF